MQRENEWMDEWSKECESINGHNNNLINEIFGDDTEEFEDLVDGCIITDRIEIVSEPQGNDQAEDSGKIVKKVYVDQWTQGCIEDSYAGYIYAKIEENKWLKIPYNC